MAVLFSVPTDTDIEKLERALKKRDKFAVDGWLAEKTRGRVQSLNSDVYEAWIFLAQMWTYPDLKNEVLSLMRSLK